MKEFKVDLHIHTCLSPCADLMMLPTKIIRQAKRQDLDIIGICDHNSVENVLGVKKAGEREGLRVLGGIEITSLEEVHIMGFFDDETSLEKVQELVYKNLVGKNDETLFGEQRIVDHYDRIIGSNKKLLIGATGLAVDKIVKLIHNLGGLAIASHIDKEAFSIISQLGFIPKDLDLDALELSLKSKVGRYDDYNLPLVYFSDAHYLEDIGRQATYFIMEEESLSEILKALQNRDGRSILAHT